MMLIDSQERRALRSNGKDSSSEGADDDTGSDGLAAAGALASSAVIAEAIQIAGTAVLFYFGQQWSGTDSPVEAVSYMIDYLQQLPGLEGYAVFGSIMIFLQVVPIAAAFVLTVSAGAIFGAVKGTATVLTCSTISATISFFISRTFGRERLLEAAQESKQFRAIDAAFADKPFETSLTLITLLRLSPVLPFSWANYVFGLSPVPLPAFSIGTFVGCLPAVVRTSPTPRAASRTATKYPPNSHVKTHSTAHTRFALFSLADCVCIGGAGRGRDRGQWRREQPDRAGFGSGRHPGRD